MAEMHKYKVKVNVNMYGPLPMAYMMVFKEQLEELIETFFDKSPDAVVESTTTNTYLSGYSEDGCNLIFQFNLDNFFEVRKLKEDKE